MSPWYSLDGKYQMEVTAKHHIIISDSHTKLSESNSLIKGDWIANEEKKSITLHINNADEEFLYISPSDDVASILVSGSVENANLSKSWFSVLEDDNNDSEQQTP